jgi:hypothetical protein
MFKKSPFTIAGGVAGSFGLRAWVVERWVFVKSSPEVFGHTPIDLETEGPDFGRPSGVCADWP